MTRTQFIDAHFHAIFGTVADAATHQLKGGELSMRMDLWRRRITHELGAAYDSLTPAPAVAKADPAKPVVAPPVRKTP